MKYARKCDITNEPMNEGYCIQDGLMYIKYKKDLIIHIREVEKKGRLPYEKEGLIDDWLLNDYYESDYYYFTEWEDESEYQYEIINGTLTLIED